MEQKPDRSKAKEQERKKEQSVVNSCEEVVTNKDEERSGLEQKSC